MSAAMTDDNDDSPQPQPQQMMTMPQQQQDDNTPPTNGTNSNEHPTSPPHQRHRGATSLAAMTTSRCVNTPLPPLSLLTGKPGATSLTATWQ